jgi:hypothetical protein
MENEQDENGFAKRAGNSGTRHAQELVHYAHAELRQLQQQHSELVRRIGTVKQTIAGLAKLFGDNVLSEELQGLLGRKSQGRQLGFTEACRVILMESGRALSRREVCAQLQVKVPSIFARHINPIASVSTVLNRLVHYGEAQPVVLTDGQRAFQWVTEPRSQSQIVNGGSQTDP